MQDDKIIQREKMFNRRDDEMKKKIHDRHQIELNIQERNTKIEEYDKKLDKERRKQEDRTLMKKQQELTGQLSVESKKLEIDISIAKAKIEETE